LYVAAKAKITVQAPQNVRNAKEAASRATSCHVPDVGEKGFVSWELTI